MNRQEQAIINFLGDQIMEISKMEYNVLCQILKPVNLVPEDLYRENEHGYRRLVLVKGHVTYLGLEHLNLPFLDEAVGKLRKLEEIDVGGNNLTGLPGRLVDNGNLKSLGIYKRYIQRAGGIRRQHPRPSSLVRKFNLRKRRIQRNRNLYQ